MAAEPTSKFVVISSFYFDNFVFHKKYEYPGWQRFGGLIEKALFHIKH